MKHLITTLALGAALSSVQAATLTTLVPEKSSITFSYKQMGVGMDGKFKTFAAQTSFDPAKVNKATGRLDIDLASIDTGSSEANDEVVGKAWFNVAAYPKASFVLQSLKPTGNNHYEATGQLSIKGQTHELRMPLQFTAPSTLTGSFVLKRADFGIGEGMWAKFDVVANEITVRFSLNLK